MKEISDSKDWRGEAGRLVNAMARYFDDPSEQNKRIALAAIKYCKDLGL